jgi:hypothetical protein
MSLCVLLTIANAVSHRRRTWFARNPCPFRWNRTPWPPTSCARLPRQCLGWLGLSSHKAIPGCRVYPRGPEIAWASLFVRPSGLATLRQLLSENSFATYCGLHVTPVAKAQQSLPVACPPAPGPRGSTGGNQERTSRLTQVLLSLDIELCLRRHLHHHGPHLRY